MTEIIDCRSGTLAHYIRSNRNWIMAGTLVDIYTLRENNMLCVKVCSLDGLESSVYLSFADTDIDLLLKEMHHEQA